VPLRLPLAVRFIPPPTVTGISPNFGPVTGGTSVTVTGTGFVSGAALTFAGAPATGVTVVSTTSITATAPAGTVGAVDVVVINPDSQTGTLAAGYTYIGPPTVTTLSVTTGPTVGGTALTITGAKFVAGATVTFGSAAGTSVTVVSATSITVTTPAHTGTGAVNVVVTNPDGQSGTKINAFTYNAPKVTSFAPTSSATVGGTVVTITGTYYAAGATVQFGGINATGVTVVNSTTITATTPAHVAGTVTVAVFNSDGVSGSLANNFVYGPPAVSSISPVSGATTGGTAITINGAYFATGATVTLGGAAATGVTVVSATKITATTPAHAAGAVDVVVANSDGVSGTLTSGFTYAAAPTVGSISPATGTTNGGTAVTITGTNFVSGATVTIGGAAATGVNVASATSITATTPAGTAGAADVRVTTIGGSGVLAGGYTYTSAAAPTVASLNVTTGTTNGGTAVTLTGTGFVSGASVTFGGTAATGVSVVSATSITLTTRLTQPAPSTLS
jgi:hypothetical protein